MRCQAALCGIEAEWIFLRGRNRQNICNGHKVLIESLYQEYRGVKPIMIPKVQYAQQEFVRAAFRSFNPAT